MEIKDSLYLYTGDTYNGDYHDYVVSIFEEAPSVEIDGIRFTMADLQQMLDDMQHLAKRL